MSQRKHIVIVGAGVAGLTAAYELTKAGHAVSVFEQRDEVGGLARSVVLERQRLDRYYHFICRGDGLLVQLAGELGIADRLRWRPAPTSYHVAGRLYPFTTPLDILRFAPISLRSRLRFGLHGARARRFTNWERIEHLTAEQWLVNGMGQEAYETIWEPLLRMKFADARGEVSAPWIWHRMHRVLTSRESLLRPERFGCFPEGSWTLLSALAERIAQAGGEIHLGRRVRGIAERDGRAVGVTLDEGETAADAVISTAPLPALASLLPDAAADYRAQLQTVRFMGVACLLLRLRAGLTSSFWVNANDPRLPFQGFVEYSNLCAPDDGEPRVVYIPLYMPSDDPRFVIPEQALADALISGLETLLPAFDRSQVVDWLVTRDAHAQAVCPPGFARRVPAIASPLPDLLVTDSTQLYPADRNVSGTIGLARAAARLCLTS